MSTSPEALRDPVTGLGPDEITEEGVDRTLIRWFLSLTPDERLMWAQGHAQAVLKMRGGRMVRASKACADTEDAVIEVDLPGEEGSASGS
ncbi:hypothetical protein EA187_02490 [Lujinxingia sediminis]|uniref:Uncharacterized protein n=1 Tax=Lujinxingia sediminis TaxID=2480984 RepID=A0ABY0CWS1_9DELT|nr:hypothetical protein [Lujinxingia sediminis]RVU48326.1 hypothetical protein EA187_02490 [Lujinxingia sediminis]